MRYEAAVETTVTFHTREPPGPEAVVIEFGGRRFVWHVTSPDDEGQEYWPTVTTLVADPDDYGAERESMERFFSALSFSTGMPIEGLNYGGSGGAGELDRPVARALRRGLANFVNDAPAEIVVVDDPRLRLVLAHHRDGLFVVSRARAVGASGCVAKAATRPVRSR